MAAATGHAAASPRGQIVLPNAKGKLFGRLAKDIMIAARSGADAFKLIDVRAA